jgi:hypothetical protein
MLKFLRLALLRESDHIIPCYRSICLNNTLTYRPIVRQRLGKHIPAGADAHNNRISIATQRISKQAFSTIEWLFFLRGLCCGAIKVSCYQKLREFS